MQGARFVGLAGARMQRFRARFRRKKVIVRCIHGAMRGDEGRRG
jgi:hypothetical protein